MTTAIFLLLATLLMISNGFFVAIEFCLVGTSPSALEVEANKGNRRAATALKSLSEISHQVAGAQLGITMSSLALGILAEPSVEHLVEKALPFLGSSARHTVAAVIALIIVAFFHMMIGEMVPKNLALANPTRMSIWLMPIHRVFVAVMRPLIWLLNALTTRLLGLLGVERVDERAEARTPAELARLLEESRGDGVLDDFEHSLLAGALDLGEAAATSVMVPWSGVATVDINSSVAEIEAIVVDTGHSRLPVVEAGSVTGWVHSKDLLALDPTAWGQPVPASLVRPMMWVRPEQPLEEVLLRMQRARRHFAVVLGEEATALGIVTLEDVLESVVGELIDETDVVAQP